MVQMKDVSGTAREHEVWAASGRETAHSADRTTADSSINHLQLFQAPVAYWLFELLHVNVIHLLICS